MHSTIASFIRVDWVSEGFDFYTTQYDHLQHIRLQGEVWVCAWTLIQTHRHIHTHTQIHSHIDTHSQEILTQKDHTFLTQTHPHQNSHNQTHTDSHTQSHTHTHSHMTHTETLIQYIEEKRGLALIVCDVELPWLFRRIN